jgi:hypothetical protein
MTAMRFAIQSGQDLGELGRGWRVKRQRFRGSQAGNPAQE